MGLPFWQAGEEFARTKKGQGNSYRSSPALNRLDWQRAQQFHELVDYYRGLIGLRRYFPRLSALDTASPAAIQFFSLEQPLVGWQLPANFGDGALWQALCVFYNPTGQEKTCLLYTSWATMCWLWATPWVSWAAPLPAASSAR